MTVDYCAVTGVMESKEEGFTFVGGGSDVLSISVCPH